MFSEDQAWSVALACGSLFALVGVLERPSWGRIATCGVLVLCTNLNRSTTGYSHRRNLPRLGAVRTGRSGPTEQHWALPLAGAALVPLAIECAINLAKFGVLFGVPFQDQVIYKAPGLQKINGGNYFGLYWLPSTIPKYIDPANFRFTSLFPYIYLPDAATRAFDAEPTANVPLSMPLLFVAGLRGVITTFTPGRPSQFRVLRLLLIASGTTTNSKRCSNRSMRQRTRSEAVASFEDHIKDVRTGSGDVITLALREAKAAFEHAAEMCQKVLDSYSARQLNEEVFPRSVPAHPRPTDVVHHLGAHSKPGHACPCSRQHATALRQSTCRECTRTMNWRFQRRVS